MLNAINLEKRLETLRKIAEVDPLVMRSIVRKTVQSYDEFVETINSDLDAIAATLTEGRKSKQKHSEDAISDEIHEAFIAMGYNSAREPQTGGHVDLKITHHNWMWMAEAKLDHDHDHVYGGFVQLTTRYADGLDGRNKGALLVYLRKHANPSKFFASWKSHIESESSVTSCSNCPTDTWAFITETTASTGLPYTIRHKPISIRFDPQDKKKPKLPKKK